MQKLRLFFVGCLGLLATPLLAHHDTLVLYQPYTIERGEIETALWTDLRSPSNAKKYIFHQTEVEYGLTSNYTTALYGVFQEGLGFTGVKWANRFFLGQFLYPWPMDLGLYVEFAKANAAKTPDELEFKLLMNKKVGNFNLMANPIIALEQETKIENGTKEKELELETTLLVGTSFSLAQLTQNQQLQNTAAGITLQLGESAYITPQLNVALTPFAKLNIGPALGLTPNADRWQLRSIVEIEF